MFVEEQQKRSEKELIEGSQLRLNVADSRPPQCVGSFWASGVPQLVSRTISLWLGWWRSSERNGETLKPKHDEERDEAQLSNAKQERGKIASGN